MVHRRVGGVDIFGLFIGENPPAKGHHIAPQVNNGKHDPVVKPVHGPAASAAKSHIGLDQLVFRVFQTAQMVHKGKPSRRRKAQAEMADGLHGEPPAQKVIQPRLPLLGKEHPIVKPSGLPIDFQYPGPKPGHTVVHLLLGDWDSRPLGQEPHGFHIVQILNLPDKGNHISPYAAAKTIKGAVVRIHVEGSGLFVVEGTESHQIATAPAQVYIGGYQLRNVCPGLQLLQK